MRCLSLHSKKDLTDFLARERLVDLDGEDASAGFLPCTLFLEVGSRELALRVVQGAGRVGGWGRILRGAGPRPEGIHAVLVCATANGLARLAGDLVDTEEAQHLSRRVTSVVGRLSRDAPEPIDYRGKTLDFSRGPLVMGVLNVTPDSFYDGGCYLDPSRAEQQALQLIEQGADILDVGGASTRPGSDRVPDPEQIRRILPVIRAVRRHWDGWISVDTYAAGVAHAALEEGADMINDISAGRMDPGMKELAARTGAPAVLMHMQGTPRDMQLEPAYDSLFDEIIEALDEGIRSWEQAGCRRENLLIDPGIGFGKNLEHNLRILRNLREFQVLGRPVVLGTSRKSFIGAVLGRVANDRLTGTLATLVVGVLHGAHVLRVHDVAQARETLDMVRAIQGA